MVCLEGNESGTYFRGSSSTVDGVALIEVPEVFRLASIADRMTVQTTPVGAPALMWIESRSLDTIVVRSDQDVEFDYFVNGVRRGYEGLNDDTLIVDNSSYWPMEADVPFGTQYPDSYRQMLVENGILNPDFTANGATMALMEASNVEYAERKAIHVQQAQQMAALEAAESSAGIDEDAPPSVDRNPVPFPFARDTELRRQD